MEVLNQLKAIYKGENAIQNHITLFSILGIVVILLNNIVAAWGPSSMFFDFFAVAPSSRFELWISLTVCLVLMIYLFGYDCKFVHSRFENMENGLPTMDLAPMTMFFKTFPVFVLWQVYYAFLLVFGAMFILPTKNSTLIYLLSSLLVCSLPFTNLILVRFTSDFRYSKEIMLPSSIFKYIDKCLIPVICVVFGVIVLTIIPGCGVYYVANFAHKISSEPLRLSVYLADVCVFVYLIAILKFAYLGSFAKIVKSKIFNQG